MRIPDLNKILSAMLKTYDGISDLNFTVGHPLQVEDFGELKPVFVDPPIEALTPYQTEQIALTLMRGNRRLIYDYLASGSCDCSYCLNDEARFRISIFRQQGHFSIVLRKLYGEVPTIQSLGLPPIFHEITKEKTGLVLVTGATGSGKTTTLAALLDEINAAGDSAFARSKKPGGFFGDVIAFVSSEDRLIESHPTKWRAGFNDLVETAVLAFSQRDGFLGAQVVAKNFSEQLPAAADLWRKPLANDESQSVSETNTQLFFFTHGKETEDTVDGLASVNGVQRAQNQVPGFRRHERDFNRSAITHFAHQNYFWRLT